jgi:TPR repeat protein
MMNTLLRFTLVAASLLAFSASAVADENLGEDAPQSPLILQDDSLRSAYERRALDGEVRAASLLVDYYLSGDDSQRSMAIYWLRIYSRNTGKASMMLGGLLLASENTEEQEEGVAILKEMAAEGDEPAVSALARFYHSKKDLERARFWTERAAILGDVSSMIRLGEDLSKYRDSPSRIVAATWFLLASSKYGEQSFMAIDLRRRGESLMVELNESSRLAVRNYVTELVRASAH